MEVASAEVANFNSALAKEDVELETFANDNQYGEGDYGDEIHQTYDELITQFNTATGLTLELGYHDEDNGSRYDGVSGAFWNVGGVYVQSEAGKKYADKINREYYVEFG